MSLSLTLDPTCARAAEGDVTPLHRPAHSLAGDRGEVAAGDGSHLSGPALPLTIARKITPGADIIVGLGGNDFINGKGGDDLICGGAGDGFLVGSVGNDALRSKRCAPGAPG